MPPVVTITDGREPRAYSISHDGLKVLENLLKATCESHDVGAEVLPAHNLYQDAHLRLDYSAQRAWYKGRERHLPPTQWAILRFLVQHRREVITLSGIHTAVWGTPKDNWDKAHVDARVKWQVSRLRKSVGAKRILTTVRGTGYRYDPPSV